jgi:hypothetical protein
MRSAWLIPATDAEFVFDEEKKEWRGWLELPDYSVKGKPKGTDGLGGDQQDQPMTKRYTEVVCAKD